jgi:ATP-binding cassette, subfamily B, multidrug efflux pump
VGFWGGGGGWGGPGGGGWGGGMRGGGGGLRRAVDAWDDEELGSAYNHDVVVRLLGYVKPHWKRAVLSFIGVVGAAVLLNYQPALIADGIDSAVAGDTGGVLRASLTFLAFVIFGWAFVYIQFINAGFVGHSVLLKLRTDMFAHLQKLSLRFYDNNEVGRVMSRVQNDVTSMQELLSNGFLTIFGDMLGLLVVVYVVMSRDVKLALVTFSVVPVLIAATAVWQIYARKAFIRVRQAIAIVNSNLQENVSGVRVIQSLSREDVNAQRFDALNEDNMRANISAGRLQAAVMPMVEVVSSVAMALVVLYGGSLVLDEKLTLGTLVLFLLSLDRFFQPIRQLVMQYAQLQRAMAGGVRAFEVLDTEPEIVDAPDAVVMDDIEGHVTFENVNFDYVDGVPVLRDINLDVKPGETVALVGSTGAGKTTLTALILRFYEVTQGRILIDGVDLKQIDHASLTRRTGVVLQDPFLFSGTVKQNILYGRLEASDEEVMEAAKAVGAHDFIMRLDHGYDTDLHERGQNLSVGQRQLISFARAVLARPRILILDEATANVDTRTEVVIQAALRNLLKDRTSFVIAHRLSTIREATRILVMDQGRIAEMGSHDELLAQGGIYANLYRMTFEKLEEPTEGVTAD